MKERANLVLTYQEAKDAFNTVKRWRLAATRHYDGAVIDRLLLLEARLNALLDFMEKGDEESLATVVILEPGDR